MISKKTLALTLSALGLVTTALTTGCDLALAPSLEIRSSMYDAYGYPMRDIAFDYYLDITTYGGTRLGYYVPNAVTDSFGEWNASEYDLTFYQGDALQCANTCVQWDEYGCNVYATDCWNSSYAYALDPASINPAYTNAAVGFQTLSGYYDVYGGWDLGSYFDAGVNAFYQKNEFDTDLVVIGASARIAEGGNTSAEHGKVNKAANRAKPTLVSDVGMLSGEQKSKLMSFRNATKLPAEAFSVKAELVGAKLAAKSAN
jgi:hypothetical protein